MQDGASSTSRRRPSRATSQADARTTPLGRVAIQQQDPDDAGRPDSPVVSARSKRSIVIGVAGNGAETASVNVLGRIDDNTLTRRPIDRYRRAETARHTADPALGVAESKPAASRPASTQP